MTILANIKSTRRKYIHNMSPKYFDFYANSGAKLKGYKHRIYSINDKNIIKIVDDTRSIFMCRRTRISLYKKGIENRINRLIESYLLDHIDESLSGAFIDCGANIGELGAFSRNKGLEYHAFEPEALEADCCDLNNFDGAPLTNRIGLWSEDGVLNFYSKPLSADSSIFEPDDYVTCQSINVRCLDSYVAEKDIAKIAVLKIEAEGAEPEVLFGAKKSLNLSRYVTIDCGFERGKEQESTLIPVINIMLESGFEAMAWNPARTTVLFRNKTS